jgi:hypothetical protein
MIYYYASEAYSEDFDLGDIDYHDIDVNDIDIDDNFLSFRWENTNSLSSIIYQRPIDIYKSISIWPFKNKEIKNG